MEQKVISLNALKDLKRKAIEKITEAIQFAKWKDTRRFDFEKWFSERREMFDDCEEICSLMRQYAHYDNARY